MENNSDENILIDSSRTMIIPFTRKFNHPFPKSYTPTILIQDDIDCIDSLFISGVTDHNNSLDEYNQERLIDLKKYNYRKQLIAAINKKGEKELWVNCFCNTLGDTWKSEILSIMDGGSCYFNFKINLATKKVYDFEVNGSV